MLRLFCGVVAIVACSLGPLVRAEEVPVIPAATKLTIQIDFDALRDAFRETAVGRKGIENVKKAIEEEIEGEGGLAKVVKALGFDPFDELHGVTAFISNFEAPKENLRLVFELGKTTGNLEGLLLAIPGYSSLEYKDVTIHCFHDSDPVAMGAIHTDRSGAKRIVLATNQDDVVALLKMSDDGRSACGLELPPDAIASVRVTEFPEEAIEEGPPRNIAKLVEEAILTVSVGKGNFQFTATLKLRDEKRAEQIAQLARGAVALLSLGSDGDEEVEMVAELLRELTATTEGVNVKLRLTIPVQTVTDVLEEEFDLEL